jgi:hypothetical protein
VNSEELELSLRTEFESYLNGVIAEMKQDVAEFQKKIETEFDKHKSQLDEAFKDFSGRLNSDKTVDQAFKESVVEHLRLARDEGAKLSANAFAQAEDMEKIAHPQSDINDIRDAVNDISEKKSQSAIRGALIDQCERFTPRGAFFIVKNDHFVGWRAFGREAAAVEEAARDLHFPVASDTTLGESIRTLRTAKGSPAERSGDSVYLDPLQFGSPAGMYAIPLIARGRGVAVLYADSGENGNSVDLGAIETLVRVAGLTVELLASSQGAKPQPDAAALASAPAAEPAEAEMSYAAGDEYSEAPTETYAQEDLASEAIEMSDEAEFETVVEDTSAVDFEQSSDAADYSFGDVSETSFAAEAEPVAELPQSFESEEVETVQEDAASDFVFETEGPEPVAEFEAPEAAESLEYEETVSTNGNSNSNGHSHSYAAEPMVEVMTTQPGTRRLTDRHVDLPIEVSDDERKFHNDARRFARLLVEEIKLYNEQKVREGREAGDLYERLREAIDRSREMYERRVHPPVASKFDYFHYELVGRLAEGDAARLGGSYPGATI